MDKHGHKMGSCWLLTRAKIPPKTAWVSKSLTNPISSQSRFPLIFPCKVAHTAHFAVKSNKHTHKLSKSLAAPTLGQRTGPLMDAFGKLGQLFWTA